MTIEKFLSFWSQHNTAIIESLVALIIIFSLFLAFRSFFAKKSQGGEVGADRPATADTAQLEKTLQKILENQTKANSAPRAAASEDLGMDLDLSEMVDRPSSSKGASMAQAASTPASTPDHVLVQDSAPAAAAAAAAGMAMESAAEVSQLRLSLNETHKRVETLQAQLAEAQQKAAEAGGAGAGMSSKEKEELTGKLRDLEARLTEYEIISEDIADLSKYRDENEKLRAEIEALKAGGGAVSTVTAAAAASAPAAPASESVAKVVSEEPPLESESTEPSQAAAEAVELFSASEPEPPAAAPEPAADSSELIDEDLMAEFAAAVEGQKAAAALEKAAAAAEKTAGEKAGGSPAQSLDDTEKLMNEFENFVSKKS